jgi:hypothetical protein
MKDLAGIICIVGVIALPVLLMWLHNRRKINETNQRAQIVLAAIEKNAETDIEELFRKMAPQKKLLKEKLLSKLLWGSIIGLLGIIILVYGLLIDYRGGMNTDDLIHIYFAGGILLAVGIAFIANYRLSKKMLVKEIEAEEKLLVSQAESK